MTTDTKNDVPIRMLVVSKVNFAYRTVPYPRSTSQNNKTVIKATRGGRKPGRFAHKTQKKGKELKLSKQNDDSKEYE